MKIVYLILCHKDPGQVIRLVKHLRDEGTFFVVHVDKRADERVYSTISEFASEMPDTHLSERSRCYWGGFGIVQATINCIQRTLEVGSAFDYAILLSGQDYPIKSNAEIRRFLKENQGKEFVESFSLVQKNRWSDQVGIFNAFNRVHYWTIFIRSRRFQIKLKRKFPFDWEPFGGSQWWCLSSECVRYVQSFVRSHAGFVRYFKFSFLPDESFFQSVISNSPFCDKVVGEDMRYVDWENPNPNYPRILEEVDFDRLKSAHKLFARKFEVGRSDRVLERIERELLRR